MCFLNQGFGKLICCPKKYIQQLRLTVGIFFYVTQECMLRNPFALFCSGKQENVTMICKLF